jgi:hypothetical protein
MTLEKQRLARHDSGRFAVTTMNWGGVASTAGVTVHESLMRPPQRPVTGGRTVSHADQGSVAA